MDRPATKDAKAKAGATEKANVRVYKSVIAADALAAIEKIANAARAEHQRRTVPWSYSGPGAITAEGYPNYRAAMADYEQQFGKAVVAFYAVYEQEREAAKAYLGAMYDPADYPTTDSLRSKFSFHVSAEPLPKADGFRVANLAPELVAEIKQDLQEQHADAVNDANVTAWGRVIERVEMLKLRLTEYSNGNVTKFYDSWLDNVAELIQLIPSINIANDPELARMQQKLTALTLYGNDDLKGDANLREQVVKQATAILAGIDSVYKQAA